MDMTGAAGFHDLVHQLRGSGVDVHISRLHGDANTVAERSGVLDSFGQDHVHFAVADAVAVAEEVLLQRPSPTDAATQSKGDES